MYAIIKHKFKGPYVNCEECPLFSYEYDDRGIKRNLCLYTENTLWWEDDEIKVDEDCPFEKLPRKKNITLAEKKEGHYELFTKNYVQGWNDCLDKIIGKEESNENI